MTPDAATDLLLSLPRYAGTADDAYKPGLERMEALLDAMDHPQEAFWSVHVAGTNGKGSVASMVAALGTAAGHTMGLHTSPHLSHVTERMRVDGVPAPDDWLADAVAAHRDAFDRIAPSFFEATVALSFRYFADAGVDGAAVEVGLGGRLDATNVLQPALAVLTSVDLDHTAILGETLPEIAREKAGIIKPETPVLSGVQQLEAQSVIREVATERNAPLHTLTRETTWHARSQDLDGSVLDVQTPVRRYEALRVAVPGRHQQRNALLALRAAELAIPGATEASIRTGLQDVRRLAGLRGRLDVLQRDPIVVADVAHNPSSIEATLATVGPAVAERGGQLIVAFNLSRDKDLDGILALLAAHDATVQPVPVDVDRATPPDRLADAARRAGLAVRAPQPASRVLADFRASAAPEDALLVTGSHDLVATLLRRVDASA
jgi:dihydrofolate synthase/folylpolyglutamate synthase